MNKKKPLVSICTPVFNGATMMERAILSVVNQTYQNIEIIIADNASTDGTWEIAKRWAAKDSRIKIFHYDEHVEANYSYERAFRSASGIYIQLLCHDDWLSRNYVEECVRQFFKYPKTAAVLNPMVSLLGEVGHLTYYQTVGLLPGVYSRDYFVSHLYRSRMGSFTFVCFMRRLDIIKSLSWVLRRIEHPENEMYDDRQGRTIDQLNFLTLLEGYDYFVFTDQCGYVKTDHAANTGLRISFGMRTLTEILRNYDYMRTLLEYSYSDYYKKYLFGLRTFFAAEMLNTILFIGIKKRFSKIFFRDFHSGDLHFLFRKYTFFQALVGFMRFFPRLIVRSLAVLSRKMTASQSLDSDSLPNYFLDKEYQFHIDA